MRTKGIVLVPLLLSLGACATIVSGSDETISVTTPEVQAANCKLQNGKGEWNVASTPGTTLVKNSAGNMTVTCEKDGYEKGSTTYASNLKGWIFGNIAFGGLVGIIIDLSTGAGFEYPTAMPVAMKKIEPLAAAPAARPAIPADQEKPGPAVGS
ncbi:MAG: hypothetical protein JWL84_6093 [Rhodospirillales bacterium]|nr:hypothetical protein [Rhodospirillales bacterium]